MRKALLVAIAMLCVASAAFGALGDVVASFRIPGTGSQAGMARANAVLFVNNYSGSRIYRCNYDTGSVTGSFAAAGGSQTRGLAYAWGNNLWQSQAYNSPYTIYRTESSNGSVYNSYTALAHYDHGSAPLATGDGGEGTTHIIVSNYNSRIIKYMTTTGSISSSHSVSQALYEIAYDWRNKLIWGGMNSSVVYGFSTTGSSVASFSGPTSNVYGITYHGQYLWVGGTSGYIYKIHCPILNVGIAPSSMGKIKAMYK